MKHERKLIEWECRYSNTSLPDKFGRWARIAYAGRLNGTGIYRGKVCRWQIAWIKQTEEGERFTINFLFPISINTRYYDSEQEARDVVEKEFAYFIKNCSTV